MPSRLAAPVCLAASALLLTGCGEAIGDPQAPDASEREVLQDAAEMLPAETEDGAPPRGRDAPE